MDEPRYFIHYTTLDTHGRPLDLVLGPYTEAEALTQLQSMRRSAISTRDHFLDTTPLREVAP